ncbi:carbohydrate sulfotransferase 15-like [Mercenaria mercenaria]|uniref:carbohydrate sulfotransferase 15-like n=1 Tax=Mercenaria mercenaria TaxID=6596 RepID=UPI00234F7F69|nr:carbohydrate sulfotransferase 15-like [Mercenaria mercenaria]
MALVRRNSYHFRFSVQFYDVGNNSMVEGNIFSVKPITYNRDIDGPVNCNITVDDMMDIMNMYEGRKLQCLPYMYLVGVAKCGTTDLFKRITLHPDFKAPTRKEPNWLSANRFCEASVNTFEGAHFWPYLGSNVGHDEPVENNAEYIYHMNSQARILINVRNPVDRLWSEYLAFSRSANKSAEIFHQIVVRELSIYNRCLRTRTLRSCMYDRPMAQFSTMTDVERQLMKQKCHLKPVDIVMLRRGVYHVFIKDYLKVFPRDHVLIQRLEDIADDPEETLIRTFNFLGLKIPSKSNLRKIMDLDIRNTRRPINIKRGGMLEATRHILHEFYRPHNEQLSILLNDSKYNYGPRG